MNAPERTQPFACVASMRDRISIAGTAELAGQVLAKHAPTAILPGAPDWCHHLSESESIRWNLGDRAASDFRDAVRVWSR